MSKADDVLKEMERIAKAFQNPDQALELDMQKVINTLRGDAKLGRDQIEAIDFAMHNPDKLKWTPVLIPEPKNDYQPTEYEMQWFRDFLSSKATQDVWKWEVSSTGQRYEFNKTAKTATLIRERPDPNDWHSRNKKIMTMLGWKVIDSSTHTRTFNAQHGSWTLSVLDFPISAQQSTSTGQMFPPGTRGQDAIANNATGVVVRLGNNIGRWFIKHVSAEYGVGKTTFGSETQQ